MQPWPLLSLKTRQRGCDGHGKSGGTDLVSMDEKLFMVGSVVGYACCFLLCIVSGSELKN